MNIVWMGAPARCAMTVKPGRSGFSAPPSVRVPSGNITSWPPRCRSATAWRTRPRGVSLRM